MRELEIKKRLVALIIVHLEKKMEIFAQGMKQAQTDAKEHTSEYGSLYDIAKEEANALRAGYSMQREKLADVLSQMQLMSLAITEQVELGSVIVTDAGAFFVSTGLIEEPLEVAGVKYDCVNLNAPIIQRIQRTGKGGTVEMGEKKVKVTKIF